VRRGTLARLPLSHYTGTRESQVEIGRGKKKVTRTRFHAADGTPKEKEMGRKGGGVEFGSI